MNKICILYLTIALFFAACSQKTSVFKRLAEVDTLLFYNCVDSANVLLIDIKPQTQEDSAYYFMLRAQTDYRLHDVPQLKQLNYSISYYEQHRDCRLLASSYYYKVCYYTALDSLPDEVFVLAKKAEQLAENTNDNDLKNKVCAALCCVNNMMDETVEALKYANREYYYATQLKSRRDMAYALIKLAVLHKDSNHADSCDYYTKQCALLADEVDDKDKSFIYNLLGDCFFELEPIAAEKYYHKALSYKKIPEAYKSLADICYEQEDTLRWRQYCDSALSNAWVELKVDIFSDMAQQYYELGNIRGFKCATDSSFSTLKGFYKSEKENYALDIQKKFDFERQQTAYEHKMHILWIVIACLIFIGAIITLFYRHLVHRAQLKSLEFENQSIAAYTKMEEQRSEIGEYTNQIDYLQRQNDELSERCDNADNIIATNNAAIAKLRHLCDDLIAKTDTVLAEGKMVYDLIAEGKSIIDFKDKFAACFYYFEKNFPEKLVIFDHYHDLTIENRIFIIADDLHKNDGIISKIFDIAESTVRSRRTKLKLKID